MPANVRPKGSGPNTRNPLVTPMSERQQLALLMQMTSSGAESDSRSPSSSSSKTRDRNERGETPLHLAAIKGDVEQVCRLLAHRADPNVADFAGWTPLHEACNHGWYEVALRLIQSGANINAKGLDNDTPLHDAVSNGHLKLVKLLVEKGADIHVKNAKGKTPLELASANVQPYLLNTNLPLPETSSSSTNRTPLRSRDDKKVSSAATDKQKSSSSSDTMETKNASSTEDVYEFKSVKDTDSSSEKNTEGADSEMDVTDPLSVPTSSANEESNKRSHSEFEGNEDSEKDEENKKKKRKEDNAKEGGKTTQRGQNKGQSSGKQSVVSSGKSGSAKTNCVAAADKKSPEDSPKPTSNNSSSDAEAEGSSNSGDGKTDLKVPPLKIVIPQSASSEQETGTSRNGKNSSQRSHQALPYVVASSNSNDSTDKETPAGGSSPEALNGLKDGEKKEPQNAQSDEQVSEQKQEPEPSASMSTSTTPVPPPPAPAPVELHPRKRKMKQREQAQVQQQAADNGESSTEARGEVHPHDQPITNCYKLFMNIRQQIEKRRKGFFLVQPKPPQGFKDYLMSRCTYMLANTTPTTPTINYPPTLPSQLKDLFAEQEKERYKLRMQHVIEKEKLVLSVEQEILRVHGRAARALANQSLPFSVCTILRDEEVYNLITPEQEEKDRNARSRYNGRLFLSWLQDVDDKWEKIKEHMLLRQHQEADSLHSVQKMNWEWKLKELSMCDKKCTPKIDDLHVPLVQVSDDFDLLPT
ncbi:ankyrin repeat domain-containing protein 31 [Euwallacea similis]|uniref:ankyrin repeat domain-containing protein 31 n=1 Tax=Euwallacea similis TaxID=1736056 RepID=UPI00344CA1BD